MVLDSIGELGMLGWAPWVIIRQYFRAIVFCIKRSRNIPGNTLKLLFENMGKLKIVVGETKPC
jgi:hypothetical protein